MSVHAQNVELIYAIESPDGAKVYAEAHTLNAILLAAATLREDYKLAGRVCDEFVITHGGAYDAAATLLAQEGMAV